ncbi:TetR/AcrR family transcriptional regulator [Deinococcus deserti]|uniref:Putative transcriptional regulator, TetR family n=1 Tax=Deinococcus deserti (strain DSM 17065 / CIP 109153 / LMG 22923 / VCD115) TaxID=546414 RepID=C1CXM8_DEIDV|nr:TetR/AcrR family transcriptional regulator [Deinococcus deserti]ACO44834.1 putative transcriptional regulator, TetR family [Deinococcus deserti VCD115]
MPDKAETVNQILALAQNLVQERGFNAVSYGDISRQLGIRNASIHYYFPSKNDLGTALARHYRQRLEMQLNHISQNVASPAEQLEQYLQAYQTVVHEDGRICLCTVLAGEYNTLPVSMQQEVGAFFDLNESWLTQVMALGQSTGELHLNGTPQQAAEALLAALEGAMLLARSHSDLRRFHDIARRSVDALRAA